MRYRLVDDFNREYSERVRLYVNNKSTSVYRSNEVAVKTGTLKSLILDLEALSVLKSKYLVKAYDYTLTQVYDEIYVSYSMEWGEPIVVQNTLEISQFLRAAWRSIQSLLQMHRVHLDLRAHHFIRTARGIVLCSLGRTRPIIHTTQGWMYIGGQYSDSAQPYDFDPHARYHSVSELHESMYLLERELHISLKKQHIPRYLDSCLDFSISLESFCNLTTLGCISLAGSTSNLRGYLNRLNVSDSSSRVWLIVLLRQYESKYYDLVVWLHHILDYMNYYSPKTLNILEQLPHVLSLWLNRIPNLSIELLDELLNRHEVHLRYQSYTLQNRPLKLSFQRHVLRRAFRQSRDNLQIGYSLQRYVCANSRLLSAISAQRICYWLLFPKAHPWAALL